MANVLCKSMLIIAIILTVISLLTPNWVKSTLETTVLGVDVKQSFNIGLFSVCKTDKKDNIRVCISGDPSNKIKIARSLIIFSILLFIVALTTNNMSENNTFKMVGMGAYILGLLSMIAGIIIFIQDVPKSTHGDKYSYDFSYYLAIVSVVLTIGAGICNLVHKNK